MSFGVAHFGFPLRFHLVLTIPNKQHVKADNFIHDLFVSFLSHFLLTQNELCCDIMVVILVIDYFWLRIM